jgi:hypothetical protein
MLDEADMGEALRRLGSVLARSKPAAATAETPYHPEDFSDPSEGEAERLYAAAGLVEAAPAPRPKRLILRRVEAPAPVAVSPEQELLMHLERVFLAELAGVEARRV